MNGDVLHAIESLSAEERAAAFDAYRYIGLEAAANVLEDTTRRWGGGHLDLDDAERPKIEADERYAVVVADDEVLARALSAFAALDRAPVSADLAPCRSVLRSRRAGAAHSEAIGVRFGLDGHRLVATGIDGGERNRSTVRNRFVGVPRNLKRGSFVLRPRQICLIRAGVEYAIRARTRAQIESTQIVRPRPNRTRGELVEGARGTDVMKKRSAASA